MPNLKQIGGGHRKNGKKCVDLMWNDPILTIRMNMLIDNYAVVIIVHKIA